MHAFIAPENDYRDLGSADASAPWPTVTVIIPVYNRAELLARTLAALANQRYDYEWDVIVVDDGSEEDISSTVAEITQPTDLRATLLHQHREGYGAGRARNLGAAHATGEVLVFIDADCMPNPELIAQHARWHRRATNLVIIGSRHHVDTATVTAASVIAGGLPFTSNDEGSDDFRRTFYRRTTQLRYGDEAFRALVSSNFSVRTDLFRSVGGFDEGFRRWGGEDTELGWRLSEAAAFIIPDEGASMFHQTQVDGEEGWRQSARQENDAQITTRIPHRFYRKPIADRIFLRPKVTWIIHNLVDDRIERLAAAIWRQSLTDFETIWVGDSQELTAFGEANQADPRVDTAPTLTEAISNARGQYVMILNGWATPDHRLAARMVRRFDSRPRLSIASVGYQLPTQTGPATYRTADDAKAINDAWSADGVAPFVWIRRRDLSKAMLASDQLADGLTLVESWGGGVHVSEALIALPGERPTAGLPPDYPEFQSDRSKLIESVRSGPRLAVPSVARYAKARLTRTPFQTLPSSGASPALQARPERPSIRYVGWVGKENFGDEVMLDAVEDLLSWGDVQTSGDPSRLLLLGGGTLINRKIYLDWLRTKDSPRIERAVFGTGVANPTYWGLTERPSDWVDFLSTCAYVGVRGPMSAAILDEWGVKSPVEIVGDPALLVTRPLDASAPDEAVVTISPARTDGELWGESDDAVFGALADLTRQLVAEGRDVRFMSCFPGDDRPIFEIMRAAGRADLPYLAAYAHPKDAIRLLAESSLVVSERLHGAVLAAACNTPFVSLEYRPKVRDFARSVDMEDYVLATNDLGGLYDMVRHLDTNRAAAIDAMERQVVEFRQRLTVAGESIRQAVL